MKKQNKLKFNFVDVIVLLVLLAGIVFVVLRFIGPGSNPGSDPTSDSDPSQSLDPDSTDSSGLDDDPEEKEAEYIITFYTSDAADYIVDHLRIGSEMTDDSITLDLGTLVDFRIGPAQISSTAADGHLVISELEGHSSVYMMSRVLGIDNGFGVTVDGLKLEIGHSMVVRTREAKFWAYVYNIQKLEDTPYAEGDVPNRDNTPGMDDDTPGADQ